MAMLALNVVIIHVNIISKQRDKFKFAFIQRVTIATLFPLQVVQNANIANFVYYDKNRIYSLSQTLHNTKMLILQTSF